jgi:hypothetical protein
MDNGFCTDRIIVAAHPPGGCVTVRGKLTRCNPLLNGGDNSMRCAFQCVRNVSVWTQMDADFRGH